MEDFAQTVAEAGFDEALLFDDGGYAKTMAGLAEYGESANKIVSLGFAVWSVVILLFLMLYPARMGRELDTMDSLGAPRAKRVFFLLGTSSIILFTGSVLGLGAGLLLWNSVTDYLTASISGGLDLGASISDFVRITAAQLGIALLAVAVLALPLTRTRGLERRK
jgi:ABC-type lipoprotein release transport system permease subunit